jgi:hypothetical protein
MGGTGTEALDLSRNPMIVDGPCLSACSWAFAANPKACYTPKARFYFHRHQDPGTGALLPEATAWWLTKVPSWVRPEMKLTSKQMERYEPRKKCNGDGISEGPSKRTSTK